VSVPPPCHGTKRHDDVLERDRHGALEDVLQHLAALAEPQLVHQKPDRRAVSKVPDCLVIQLAHLAVQALAERPETAARVERFVPDAVERELLVAFEREQLHAM
jgi:hypothetical protein